MSGDVLILILGGLLVTIGVIGGGFEVKELKVPKVGGGSRILAGIVGSVLIIVGIGMGTSTPAPAYPKAEVGISDNKASLINFSITDQLGEGQVSEQVRVLIDGKEVGTLKVDSYYPKSTIAVSVPRSGRYSYDLEAIAIFRDENKKLYEIEGVGQGSINVNDGKVFELTAVITGSQMWLAKMEEVKK